MTTSVDVARSCGQLLTSKLQFRLDYIFVLLYAILQILRMLLSGIAVFIVILFSTFELSKAAFPDQKYKSSRERRSKFTQKFLLRAPADLTTEDKQETYSCDQCGISTVGRIIGGELSIRQEFPWMVQLLENDQEFFCGGTLIAKSYVLTAAHCFEQQRNAVKALLGTNKLNSKVGTTERKVININKHPNFNPDQTKANDIAILKLEQPVVFNRHIRPICLPFSDHVFLGKDGTVIGWGKTSIDSKISDKLMKLTLPVVSPEDCRNNWYGKTLPTGTLCAGYVYGRQDSCIGDSGGPLMVNLNGTWHQVGIVSWGAAETCALTYGVYTRVTSFLPWIKSNIKDDKCFVS